MKEKISNPLTVVGIFAGIAEIAGTTVISFLSEKLQSIFIWYVMGLPILLVILFFITWNFNPSVLYSPSDYKNEDNFLTILTKKHKNDIVDIEKSIDSTKKDIVKEVTNIFKSKNVVSSEYIEKLINTKMSSITDKLEEKKYTATDVDMNSTEHKIISILDDKGEQTLYTLREIFKDFGLVLSFSTLNKYLDRLINIGIVKVDRKMNNINNKGSYINNVYSINREW